MAGQFGRERVEVAAVRVEIAGGGHAVAVGVFVGRLVAAGERQLLRGLNRRGRVGGVASTAGGGDKET